MRFPLAVSFLVCTLPSLARADALTDLRATLGRLSGTTPIRGSVDVTSTARSDDDNKPREGKVTVGFEVNDSGLRILYPRETLMQATTEARGRAVDAERPAPVRNGLRGVQPLGLADLLDAAAALSVALESAQLLEAKQSAWRGKPSRLVVFKMAPKMSKAQSKRVKKLDMKLSVWLGDDGIPLGAEQTLEAKASFLLMSFESSQKESWAFARVGDRLVATRHEENGKSDGLGQHQVERTTHMITVAP